MRFATSGALTTALKQLVVRVVRMLVSGTGMNGLPDFDSCVSEHSSTASRAHDCGLMSGAHDKAIQPLLQSHGQALGQTSSKKKQPQPTGESTQHTLAPMQRVCMRHEQAGAVAVSILAQA
jgi:hypothetical protein